MRSKIRLIGDRGGRLPWNATAGGDPLDTLGSSDEMFILRQRLITIPNAKGKTTWDVDGTPNPNGSQNCDGKDIVDIHNVYSNVDVNAAVQVLPPPLTWDDKEEEEKQEFSDTGNHRDVIAVLPSDVIDGSNGSGADGGDSATAPTPASEDDEGSDGSDGGDEWDNDGWTTGVAGTKKQTVRCGGRFSPSGGALYGSKSATTKAGSGGSKSNKSSSGGSDDG